MTTIVSNSSSPYDDDSIPTATLALPSVAASASRRLPPPCWSPEETTVLIDAYKEKWYSLRRGNLRANHWQEVAEDVASRFHSSPPKTAVQCRHKMEKLRKRYRAEIQRAAANGGVRGFTSSWAQFQSMHAMEKGPYNRPSPPSTDGEEESDHKNSIKRISNLYNNQMGDFGNQAPVDNRAASGFRIKIPGMVTEGPAETKVRSSYDEIGAQNHYNRNPIFINSGSSGCGTARMRNGYFGQNETVKRVSEISPGNSGVSEVVEAIQALGQGFMRIEKVKMDMARQVEEMRMEMELKRTEMILESQQRIVEAFTKTISERATKKSKRVSTPERSNELGAR